jgi:hypothetical protein
MWKEEVASYLKALSKYLLGETEDNHDEAQENKSLRRDSNTGTP